MRTKTTKATKLAASLGRRAGERFREHGVPAANPFPSRTPATKELAAVWRRAYFGALDAGGSR